MSASRISGIYQIRNTVNGKVYVGSAVNVSARWAAHRSWLNKGVHHSGHLQGAWLKYGEGAFSFSVVEAVERKEDLIPREQWWLDAAFATAWHYNVSPTARSSLGIKRREETKLRIGLLRKGKKNPAAVEVMRLANIGRHPSEETRAKLVAARNLRPPVSAETRAKLSASAKLRGPVSDETRAGRAARMLGNTQRLGHKHTVETRGEMSASRKGRRHSEETLAKMRAPRPAQSVAIKAYYARRRQQNADTFTGLGSSGTVTFTQRPASSKFVPGNRSGRG